MVKEHNRKSINERVKSIPGFDNLSEHDQKEIKLFLKLRVGLLTQDERLKYTGMSRRAD